METDKKCNLFIVGAMKAGTTTFVDLLYNHPDIYMSPVKEPHYFINSLPKQLYEPSRFFNLNNYLEKKFPEPLHITKVETEKQYNKIFSAHDNQKYLGEASTTYLYAKESPKLIYDYNPNAKIVVLIRDPLKRSFSHYKMMVGQSREIRSFEDVIKEEIDLYNKGKLSPFSYVGMSLYKTKIDAYKSYFEDILVMQFEDLVNMKEATLKTFSNFLNISEFKNINIRHTNQSRSLRFQKLFFILKNLGIKDYFSKLFSSKFKKYIFLALTRKSKNEIVLSSKVMEELLVIFKKESII